MTGDVQPSVLPKEMADSKATTAGKNSPRPVQSKPARSCR